MSLLKVEVMIYCMPCTPGNLLNTCTDCETWGYGWMDRQTEDDEFNSPSLCEVGDKTYYDGLR